MRILAFGPIYAEERKEYTGEGWVICVRYIYEPGETVTRTRGHCNFATQDEALAFFHTTNGSAQ